MLLEDESMNKSSIGKISGITISLIIIITSFIILKQTGIVKAQNEITGYEIAESNLTESINETLEIENETFLDISLDYPQKITRGESITAKASVTNTGSSSVKNVVMMLKLANGFEVVSGNLEERCGDLEVKNTCISEVIIKTDNTTSLGLGNIKIVVNYE